tara:strand:- start:9413 stop:17764 length:8352 start_codon:yes stop_codon:yes gene_type:complete
MPIKREASYIGLAENAEIRYDVIDRDPFSKDFFEIVEFPETLTAGKNIFKFRGDPDTLVDDSRVHVEILDYNGDPIYYEVLNYVEKDGVRVLSVFIYPDTPEGRCVFYLAGRAMYDPETDERFPFSHDMNADSWKDLPNVLWLRSGRVAPNRRNSSEIIFLQEPAVTINEVVKPFSEITDLPSFFNVITSSIANGISVSGVGPSGGYSTITTNITAPSVASLATAVTKTIVNNYSFSNAGFLKSVPEASFSANTPAKSAGTATIAIAMPSALAKSPAVAGNTSALITANVPTTSVATTPAKVNVATTNVGNSGPGGTTFTKLVPTLNSNALAVAAPQVTSVQTIVFNPPDTTTATFVGLGLTGSQHLGATVIINNPQISVPSDSWLDGNGRVIHATGTKTSIGGGTRTADCTYVGTIVDIENGSTAKLHPAFDFLQGRDSKPDGEHVIDMVSSEYTMSYWVPQMTNETQNSMSFAEIILNNIEPATGDVYSVKTQYKLMGAPGDYIDAGQTILEMKDILSDTSSNTPSIQMGVKDTPMGVFTDQGLINKYWDVDSNSQAKFDNDISGESVNLTSKNNMGSVNSHVKFSLDDTYVPVLYANTEYQLSFWSKAVTTGSMSPANASILGARIDVYMSGSKIHDTREYFGGARIAPLTDSALQLTDSSLGEYIGSVELGTGGENISSIIQFVPYDTDRYKPIFVVRKGSCYIKNVQLAANIESGFSPNYTQMNIRVPTDAMNAPMAFRFQYLDYLGIPSQTETFAQGAIFDGDNVYIEGTDNLITGSVYVGNSVGSGVEIAGVNSAFLRSIGYKGFTSASAGSGSGFMFYSGSVLGDVTDDYANGGVGIEAVQHSGSYFRYRTNPAELDIRTDKFFLGSDSQFISGANGNIELSSSNFHLQADGDVILQGTITAEAGGQIGGATINSRSLAFGSVWAISSSLDTGDPASFISSSTFKVSAGGQVTASNLTLDGGLIDASPYWKIQASTSTSDPGSFISSSDFKVRADGVMTASAGLIAGFTIDGTKLKQGSAFHLDGGATGNDYFISSSKFQVEADGDISGSQVLFTGGKIGGATISEGALNFGTYWAISASSSATEPGSFISSSKFKVSADGRATASALSIIGDSTFGGTLSNGAFWKIDNSTNVALPGGFISSSQFKVSADGRMTGSQVDLEGGKIASWLFDSTALKSTNYDASAGVRLLGTTTPELHVKKNANDYVKVKYAGASDWGVEGYNSGNAIFQLGSTNQIAGWTFDDDKLVGGNMIIKKEGTIVSDGFASNTAGSGFILTAASGGFLEVENARIRGTLATAVFEKETVNAVGGQLYIANSTTLTGSVGNPGGYYSTSDTTMSVANVSGFTGSYANDGEILSLKKIHSTGFSTEYLMIQSASRNNPSSDTDMSGQIYVLRGYSGSLPGTSGSLGDLASVPAEYTGSQVLVSTGRIGTGFVRINANPNDPTTPYIDIVERTGSAIYDIDLKARLGDLSGIEDQTFSDGVQGFGLYTTNGYFKGKLEIAGGDLSTRPKNDYKIALIDTGSAGNPQYTSSLQYISHSLGYPGGADWSLTNPARTFFNVVTQSINVTTDIPGYDNGYDLFINLQYVWGIGGNEGRQALNLFDDGKSVLIIGNDTSTSNVTGSGGTEWPIKKHGNYTGGGGQSGMQWMRGLVATGSGLSTSDPIISGLDQTTEWSSFSSTDGAGGAKILKRNPGGGSKVVPIAISGSTQMEETNSEFISGSGLVNAWYMTNPRGGRLVCLHQHDLEDVTSKAWNTGSADIQQTRIIDFLLKKDLSQEQYQSGITTITGNMVSTGKIQSTNYATDVGTEFNLNDGTFKMGGSAAPNLHFDGTNLIVSGAISASKGQLAGFDINGDKLQNGSNFYIDGGATANNFFISSSNFNIKANGDITGSDALLTGGKIADFTIDGTKLKQGSAFHLDGASNADFFISSSNFQVTPTGQITGSSALLTGGKVGGWTIGATLSATNVLLDPAVPKITLGAKTSLTDNSNNGFYAGTDGISLGSGLASFVVTAAGALAANSATITGAITATSGDIAGNVTIGNPGTSDGNVIFFEDWSQYANMAAVISAGDAPKTDGTGHGWYPYASNGEDSLVTGQADSFSPAGNGTLLRMGNDSGNDEFWISSNQLIPINASSLYEIEVRCRTATDSDNDALAYFGITAFAANGTTKVNANGNDSYGSQHYFALSGDNLPTTFAVYKGYFKGLAASGAGGKHATKTDPGTIDDGAENGYFAPMFLANYNDNDGITDVDYIKVTEFAQGGGSTIISGDSITTGKLTSTNYGNSAGSELDLNAGTIKLGGSDSPDFQVTSAGVVTAVAGTIGAWTLGASTLTGGNMVIDSAGKISTSVDADTTRIIIDGSSAPAEMSFYSASSEHFELTTNIQETPLQFLSKGGGATMNCPTTADSGLSGFELKNEKAGIMSNLSGGTNQLKIFPGNLFVKGKSDTGPSNATSYTLLSRREHTGCAAGVDLNSSVAAIKGEYVSDVNDSSTAMRIGVMGTSRMTHASADGDTVGVYGEADEQGTGTAYSFYGAAGTLYNTGNVSIGGTLTDASYFITASKQFAIQTTNANGNQGFDEDQLNLTYNTSYRLGISHRGHFHHLGSANHYEFYHNSSVTAAGDLRFKVANSGDLFAPALGGQGGTNYVRYNTTTGEVGYQSSTEKIKKNITGLASASMDAILSIQPVSYDWKNGQGNSFGFIAEQVASASVNFASYGPNYEYDNSGSIRRYKADAETPEVFVTASNALAPIDIDDRAVLAAAVAKIKDLEARLKVLEG